MKAKKKRGEPILYPPNPAPHMTDWLFEIGPSVSGGMGEAAIGWQDLVAWQGLTGIELDPWEARTMRQLSQAFVAQRYESEKRDCPAPYNGDRSEIASRREAIAAKVGALFKAAAPPLPPPARPRSKRKD